MEDLKIQKRPKYFPPKFSRLNEVTKFKYHII